MFVCALQLFHVAYVLVKFANSPRPDLWVLERSVDFGQTYQPWQFFACEYRHIHTYTDTHSYSVPVRTLYPKPI